MRGWRLVPVALLAACAARPPLTSTLEAAVPKPEARSYAGDQAIAVAPLQVQAVGAQLLSQLAAHQSADEWGVPARLVRRPDGSVGVSLDVAQSFEAGSGQIRAAALATYAGIADVLRGSASTVLHIVVVGEAEAPVGPADTLPARRAESLRDYFARRGLAATRMRAEGRAGAAGVELILRPVVQGREAEAWLPPTGA